MTSLNAFTPSKKPNFDDFKYCLGIDLDAARLDRLLDLLPHMSSVAVSSLMHSNDMDQFCSDMLRMWKDYVNIEVWFNDCEEGMNLLNLLDTKPDFFRVRQ
ncbi:hypothetical protein GCM10011332_32780 [Terasakiella brassicae]|uniref:Uncharacterized protein n=1 Tax=Terasakiella brassicae TaxID=1634917 RepID=A0A917C7N5_9PROT|nr:hypothetical protein [Terasakiella brassicae]GGF76259.1 hypothetical protein GCM10011332_32780 [Terasakiella brassicae]